MELHEIKCELVLNKERYFSRWKKKNHWKNRDEINAQIKVIDKMSLNELKLEIKKIDDDNDRWEAEFGIRESESDLYKNICPYDSDLFDY